MRSKRLHLATAAPPPPIDPIGTQYSLEGWVDGNRRRRRGRPAALVRIMFLRVLYEYSANRDCVFVSIMCTVTGSKKKKTVLEPEPPSAQSEELN